VCELEVTPTANETGHGRFFFVTQHEAGLIVNQPFFACNQQIDPDAEVCPEKLVDPGRSGLPELKRWQVYIAPEQPDHWRVGV
jgi:hypothetical protein